MGLAIVEVDPRDEQALVAACVRGDRDAERALFRREYPRLHAMVYRVLGSSHEVDDVVQETFIAAFRALSKFRGDSKLATWLDRIAVRLCYHRLAQRRRAAMPLEVVPEPEDAAGTPHDRARARDGLRRLYAVLDRLGADARAAFALFAIDGRSIAEVAELTGTTAIAAKVRIWRARREVERAAARDAVLAEFLADAREPEAR